MVPWSPDEEYNILQPILTRVFGAGNNLGTSVSIPPFP